MSAAPVFRHLEEDLALAVYGANSGEHKVTVRGPVAVGRHAAVYQAKAKDGKALFAVKVYLGYDRQYDPVAMATRQFAALEKARKALGRTGEGHLAKPFAVLKTHGALVVEWIEGRSVLEVMRQGWVGIDAYMTRVEQAGEWLRHLHDAGEPSFVRLDGAVMADGARAELAACVGNTSVERLYGALVAAAPRVSSSEQPSSWAHGDFKASNIIRRDEGLVGIDVDLGRRGPVLFDVTSFLNDLSVNLRFPGMMRLLPFEDKLEQAFLRGYRSVDTITAVSLRFVQLCTLASVWAAETLRAPTGIRARFASMSFAALARRLATKLDLVEAEQRGALSEA
jgi:Ser/Thr protein kinase RdoA (MazF antagonist)